jgi:hypothetical protein
VARFGGPKLLKSYIETGIGPCRKIPILCKVPGEKIDNPSIDRKLLLDMLPYKLHQMVVFLPKRFDVQQETVKKVYYKKWAKKNKGSIIYILCKNPGFFINIFPDLKKKDIGTNYEFLKKTMYANLDNLKNVTDAFFVIMKSIFIPDLGNQDSARMAEFKNANLKGFINYNLTKEGNYFDCNITDEKDVFFKIYIKDKTRQLDLEKVKLVTSTVKAIDNERLDF